MFQSRTNKLFQYYCWFVVIFSISLVINSCSLAQVPSANLEFPPGKDIVEIPFERDRGWIIIKVVVNDSKELSFILDSGAPISILVNDKLASQLKLNMHGSIAVKGTDNNATQSVPLANDVKFNINGIMITGGLMAIGATTAAVSGVDGIIGKYLFEDAVVRIDWKKNKLFVTKPEKYSYHGNGEVLPVVLAGSGHFYTKVILQNNGNSIISKADIDIGNVSSYFFIYKKKENELAAGDRVISDIITGWGANGPSYGDVSRASLRIGSVLLDSVVTVYKNATTNEEWSGNIGIGLLEHFDPIFDFPHQQLILEKNENFSAPFTFNRSGIILNPVQEKDNVVIAGIIRGSPANDEGFLAGDRIFSINGIKIDTLTKNKIKELITGINLNEIELEVKQGEKFYTKKIKMRRLI